MSASHENFMPLGPSSGVNSMFEPMAAGKPTNALTSGQNRFHPYTGHLINRQRNLYEAYYASGYYLPSLQNIHVPVSSEVGTSLSGCGNNFKQGTFLSNYQPYYNEQQQMNYPWAFTPKSIENLCELNSEPGTNFLTTSSAALTSSSAPGKDRSHPFYSRKRLEPAAGMTRTRDKYRVVYTEKQRRGLEKAYTTNKFITTEIRSKISEELGLSTRQIKIWFQNRRAKERRYSRKGNYTEQTENRSAEEDNNKYENSPSSQDNTKDFLTSCRFTGNENLSEERRFLSGQCRFSNESETSRISVNDTELPSSCLFESRDIQYFRPSTSPSEWRMPTGSSVLPTVDVSPLTGNANFDFDLRL